MVPQRLDRRSARSASSASPAQPLHLDHDRRCRAALAVTTIMTVLACTLAALDVHWNYMFPEDYHTSALSGRAWVQELLNGHRDRMHDSLVI